MLIVPMPVDILVLEHVFKYLGSHSDNVVSQVKCIFWTGCRPQETLSLIKKDSIYHIRVLKKRDVYVVRSFKEPFKAYPLHVPRQLSSRRTIHRFMKNHFGINPRQYRHMFAESVYHRSGDLTFTMRALYHADPAVTLKYYLANQYHSDLDIFDAIWRKKSSKNTQSD